MAIDLGDVCPLTVEIRDAGGALAAPGAIALTITLPDLTTTTPTPANPSLGRYQVDYLTVQPGRHSVRWVATGQNASAFTDQFDVRPAVPAYIVSLADAKAQLNLSTTVTTSDEKLRGYIEAATMVIEKHLNEAVAVRSFTEVHDGGWAIALHKTPVVSVTTLASAYTGGTSYLPGDVNVDQAAGILRKTDGDGFANSLRVTYIAGRTIIPPNYTLAAHMIIEHLWRTQRGTGMGSSIAVGAEGESEFLTGFGFSVPHRALELLGPSISGVA
jgi:hypothetical protein